MLLSNAIENQQRLYGEIQEQIDRLLQQQRDIQAYLQSLGSVESKMESALSLLQEAISQVFAVCPDELEGFKSTVLEQFVNPIAYIPPSPEGDPGPNDDPIGNYPDADNKVYADVEESTIDVVPVNANIYTDQDGANPMPMITRETLDSLKVGDIRAICRSLGLNDKGVRTMLIDRILDHNAGVKRLGSASVT